MSFGITRGGLMVVMLSLVPWCCGNSVEIPEATSSKCGSYEERIGCDYDLLCHCDSACRQYDDCCPAPSAGNASQPDSAPNGGGSGPGPYEVCVGFPASMIRSTMDYIRGEYMLPKGLWLIGRCPPTWTDARGRQLCEAPAAGAGGALSDDPLLRLPVVASSAEGATYRNVFCAVCHGVPLKTVKAWKIVSVVNDTTHAEPSETLASFAGMSRQGGAVRFEPRIGGPTSAPPLRRCLEGVVGSCPAGYGDEAVAKLCRSRMAAVVEPRTGILYRNWHCALCHGALREDRHPRLEICQPLFPYPQQFATTSLTALVDFRGGGATTRLQMRNASRRLEVGGGAECSGPGEFRDPFSLRCRRLCPDGQRLKRGVCSVVSRERFDKGGHPRLPLPPPSSVVDWQGGDCDLSPERPSILVWLCLAAAGSQDPCTAWEKVLTALPSSSMAVLAEGRCREYGLDVHDDERAGCPETTAVVRVDLPAEGASGRAVESALVGLFPGPAGCPACNATARRAVLSRGCLPGGAGEPACHEYLAESEHSMRLGSWNGTGALYVRDTNALFSLSDALYRIVYEPTSSGLNATHVLTHCRDSISHFNCSFVAVNSTANRSVVDYIALESGVALVCRPPADIDDLDEHPYDLGQTVVTYVGIGLSMLALVASFVTYVVFPSLRNLAGRCVMSLIVAVFAGQLMIASTGDGVARSVGATACSLLGALLHYAVLAGFAWTNALAFHLARTLGPGAKPSASHQHRHSFLLFSLFGWGSPLVALAVSLLAALPAGRAYGLSGSAGAAARSCSFAEWRSYIFGFVLPVAGSILANAGLFLVILAGFTLRRRPSASLHSNKKARSSRLRRDALISTKVGFLLAFTWIFGFLSTPLNSPFLMYVFCILTSLQGVYIFLAFTFTQQVRALWRERLGLAGGARTGAAAGHEGSAKGALQRRDKALPSTADKRNLCRNSSPSGQPSPPLPRPATAPDKEPEPV